MAITKLVPQRRNPDLVNVHIDGEFHSAVAYASLNAQGLRTGDVVTEAQLEQLMAVDELWRAKNAALVLLSVRARARGELNDRLRRKGYSDAAAAHALAEVERLGLLDDAAFAESWVRDRLKLRPRGARALAYELVRKRVAPDVARTAVARVMSAERVSDDDLCMAAAEQWADVNPLKPGEEAARRERRLGAYLGRRGYRPGAVRAAIDAALRGKNHVR